METLAHGAISVRVTDVDFNQLRHSVTRVLSERMMFIVKDRVALLLMAVAAAAEVTGRHELRFPAADSHVHETTTKFEISIE